MKPVSRPVTMLGVATLSVALFSAPAPAMDSAKTQALSKELKQVIQKIQNRYERTRDLQADFRQTTMIEGFETPILSRGRMYIKKPGRLRWDYLDPTVEEIYVNENKVMIYVPEHKQVLVGKLTHMAASQAPLQLLQGVGRLDKQFTIGPADSDKRGEGGLPLITLFPKHEGHESVRAVDKIELQVIPTTYFIKSVVIHEVSGNRSTFEFTGIKANSGLDDKVFDFQVPADVEVVKAPTLNPP